MSDHVRARKKLPLASRSSRGRPDVHDEAKLLQPAGETLCGLGAVLVVKVTRSPAGGADLWW